MSESAAALLSGGQDALGRAAWSEAREAFIAALELEPSGDAVYGLSEAVWWLGDLDESVALRQRAFGLFREAGNPLQAAFAALLLSLDYRKQYGDSVSSGGWLSQATRLVEDHGIEELRAWLLFTRSFDCDDPVAGEALAREAHGLAIEAGDRDLELCALSQIGVTLVAQGRVDEGIRCLDESMAVALGGEGTPDAIVFASCMMMTSCTKCAEFARAAQWVRRTIEFTERYGCPFLYAECRILYGGVLFATGEWTQAEAELVAGLEMAKGAVPALHRLAVATLAELRIAQGRVEEAVRLVAGHEDHAELVPVIARLHLMHERPTAAAAVARRRLESLGDARLEASVVAELLGEAELATGDVEAARRRGEALIDTGTAAGCDLLAARGHRLAGRAAAAAGDADVARRHLDIALVAFARLEMALEVVRSRVLLARALERTEHEVAIAEAAAALASAERLGAAPDADAAAAILRRLGVQPARRADRERGDLSRREEQVLDLLAEGLSNPEIAARLHLSRKTVEHHVAHVLTKLGATSRAQAAAAAVERRGSAASR